MSRSEREGEGEDEGWFCRLQVGQRTEQSFGARRGKDRGAAVPAGDADLVLPREVLARRVLRPGLLGHEGRFPGRDAIGLPLAVSGARLSHSLLSGHWCDALWPKTEQKAHQGVAFGGS